MILDRVCRACGRSFKGGPKAWYCPECRVRRVREAQLKIKLFGPKRPIGSTDTCERCGKPYVVTGGSQRFCPDCQRPHALEYDRMTSLHYYHENADRINPIRAEKRRKGIAVCSVCGKEFTAHTRQKYCSDECRKIARAERRSEHRHSKK